MGFCGRKAKPDFHHIYPPASASAVKRDLDTWLRTEIKNHEYREQVKAERRKPHTLKEGDILVASWGWEQTNINFYEVVSLSGKTIVVIRELQQVRDYNNATMQGCATPVPGAFKNDSTELRLKVDGSNQVKVSHTRAGLAEYTIEDGVKVYRPYMFSDYA